MTTPAVEHAPDARRIYWIQKLSPFRHGNRIFPAFLQPEGGGQQFVRRCMDGFQVTDFASDVICLAAFSIVLHRYNSGEKILIACAPAPECEDRSPLFLCCAVDEESHCNSLLESVRLELEETRRQAPCPLREITSAAGSETGNESFLQIGFGFNCSPPSLPLSMAVQQRGVNLDLTFSFDASRYPGLLIEQMANHVARTIAFLAGGRMARIRTFDFLANEERRKIGHGFNSEVAELPTDQTLHGLIEAQCMRRADSIAITYGDIELTYRKLNEQANRLAAYLRGSMGVQTGDAVGVMTRRSEKMVIAMLGIMKAGAAYVPINPRHPWDVVRYMIENAGINVLLMDTESIASGSTFSGQLFILDVELDGLSTPAANSNLAVPSSNLAYVIYTSGSTGRPKGVAIEHRAILNTLLWRNEFYGFTAADVNLQMPSFAFDSSVVDIFCVLAAGGVLVIPDEELCLDGRYLKSLMVERRITSFIATPSYYKLLVDELSAAAPDLRCVTVAGESITPELVAAHAKHLPHVTLFNEYGPTENSVCSTACILRDGDSTVPIGKPIANVKVFVLDHSFRLCPIGVPGEIYLGGVGVARGYLNQPQLTAERFIPSPIPDLYSGVLYKTGDRACWRPDGMLEFLGRLDNQVKVRGFRIELDEVENALLKHPRIQNGAVICKEDSSGAKYLVAYATTNAETNRAELREHMRSLLPYYMIPDTFVFLPKLPLNLNGKIDRNLLRAINDTEAQNTSPGGPMTPLEATLLRLSSDILKKANVQLDDSFFDLGGNSLRVMEFISSIRNELSQDVALLDIYTYPTVRELAHRLGSLK